MQEALANARRHAPGAGVQLTTTVRQGRLVVVVENAVPRGPASSAPAGYGLVGMRERAALVGGLSGGGSRRDGSEADGVRRRRGRSRRGRPTPSGPETRAVGGRGDGDADARAAATGGADAAGARTWRVRLELPVEREPGAADGRDGTDTADDAESAESADGAVA